MKAAFLIVIAIGLTASNASAQPSELQNKSLPENIEHFRHVHGEYQAFLSTMFGPLSAEHDRLLDRLWNSPEEAEYWKRRNVTKLDLRLAVLSAPEHKRLSLIASGDYELERVRADHPHGNIPSEIEIAINVEKYRKEVIRRLIHEGHLKFVVLGGYFALVTPRFEALLRQDPSLATLDAYKTYTAVLRSAIAERVDRMIRNSMIFRHGEIYFNEAELSERMAEFNDRISMIDIYERKARNAIVQAARGAAGICTMTLAP